MVVVLYLVIIGKRKSVQLWKEGALGTYEELPEDIERQNKGFMQREKLYVLYIIV